MRTSSAEPPPRAAIAISQSRSPDDLGGASSLTEAQRALVRQAAAMIVQSEKLQGEVLRGETVDSEQLVRLANAATRILSRLGLKRTVRDATPTLAEIAARHRLPKVAAG